MATDGDRSAIHRQRAANLIALRKFERAAQEARCALQRHPDDAEPCRLLAWALWQQDELSRAESAARSALRLAPNEAEVHSTLALLFGIFSLLDLIWAFFVWVVDPLVTHAVLEGWIQ